jgi:uncharacterized membrane protein
MSMSMSMSTIAFTVKMAKMATPIGTVAMAETAKMLIMRIMVTTMITATMRMRAIMITTSMVITMTIIMGMITVTTTPYRQTTNSFAKTRKLSPNCKLIGLAYSPTQKPSKFRPLLMTRSGSKP